MSLSVEAHSASTPPRLLSHLDTISSGGAPELTVVGTNGADVPPAYRLLVMLHGIAPAGYRPFDGPKVVAGVEARAV